MVHYLKRRRQPQKELCNVKNVERQWSRRAWSTTTGQFTSTRPDLIVTCALTSVTFPQAWRSTRRDMTGRRGHTGQSSLVVSAYFATPVSGSCISQMYFLTVILNRSKFSCHLCTFSTPVSGSFAKHIKGHENDAKLQKKQHDQSEQQKQREAPRNWKMWILADNIE